MDHTTPNHRNENFLAPFVRFSMIMGVGTGGDYTPSYHSLRSEKYALHQQRGQPKLNLSIETDVEYAKSVLNLTMTEVARAVGVSRQALYNWIAGGHIKDENLAKLSELKFAANVIAVEKLPERALLLRRKLPGGKTLLETVAEGGSGADAARSLVEMAKEEAEQRAALSKLFATRQAKNVLGHGVPPVNQS